jgi:hypothetical protein
VPATLLLTDALADELAAAVEAGVPIETAAQAAGVSKGQFYAWLQAAERKIWPHGDPISEASLVSITSFADKVARAQARFEARKVQNVARAAEVVNAKTGQVDWRADAWLLNNHPRYRKTYRQERQLEVHNTGTVQHEHKIAEQATDDELRAWSAIELPAPTSTDQQV